MSGIPLNGGTMTYRDRFVACDIAVKAEGSPCVVRRLQREICLTNRFPQILSGVLKGSRKDSEVREESDRMIGELLGNL